MKKDIKKIIIMAFVMFLLTGCMGEDTDYVAKGNYRQLDIQELHNDYDSNEISAENKYEGNYYYFSGEIYDVVEFLGDTYLTFMFHSNNPNAKTSGIDISAYFANKEMLTNVKKGDVVTVYCKFKERSIENYSGTSGYSLHSCRFEDDL